jgi:hypothetical protein
MEEREKSLVTCFLQIAQFDNNRVRVKGSLELGYNRQVASAILLLPL